MFSESYFLRRPAAQFVPVNGLCKQDSCIFAAANLHFPASFGTRRKILSEAVLYISNKQKPDSEIFL